MLTTKKWNLQDVSVVHFFHENGGRGFNEDVLGTCSFFENNLLVKTW